MSTAIFDESCQPDRILDGKIPAIGPDWQSLNIDGLYFAGTLMQGRDVRRSSSAFIDGFRYNLRALSRLLRERYDNLPLEGDHCPADPDQLADAVLGRANWSSALWTQFEYLCDVYVVDEAGGGVRHYADLPEDYVIDRFADQPHYYTLTLRWGRHEYRDVFAIRRHPIPERAAESAFIHPVVRRWHHRELVAEQHLLEDLLAHWQDPSRHVRPLRAFFSAQLRRTRAVSPDSC